MTGKEDINLLSVSAADLARHFGEWQDNAKVKPVIVTRHGRNTHALLSYDQYLALLNNRTSINVVDQSKADLFDEGEAALLILSEQLIVLAASRSASSLVGRANVNFEGSAFAAMLPEAANELIHRYLRRTVATGEFLSADAQINGSDRWVHFQTRRVAAGVSITLRDTTDDVTARHMADVKQTVMAAIERDAAIGYARISVREMVERANLGLVELLGITEEAFRRVRFSTVIPGAHRTAFLEALERCFAGGGPQSLDLCLMANGGAQIPVRLSIVELRGDYAPEGAILLLTRACD
jgi:PAS domain-containing protein